MHIGVDATCWHNNRGYGRHARALLTALINVDRQSSYTLFMDSAEAAYPVPSGAGVQLLHASVPTTHAASANSRRSVFDMLQTSRALSCRSIDLLLYPTVYSYVPAFSRARKILIIHDVIAETYPQLTVPTPSARLFWKAKVALGRFQANAIVTVSEYSRRHIINHFGLPADRVFVVGEASDPIFRPLTRPQLPAGLRACGVTENRRIVVYVGGFGPHKNLAALVSAFAGLHNRFNDAVLVMVGEHKNEVFHTVFQSISAQVEKLRIADRVIFPGYMSDEDLVQLLNIASVLVLPSLMEGFGLPAVEAAACGCPVIATKESPLPELLGDGGIFIDPVGNELGPSLETILDSPTLRSRMRSAALQASGRLTWNAAARQMLDVIHRVGLS